MNGTRYPTAFFITLADLITWGRNIRPEPNRSPTTDMPWSTAHNENIYIYFYVNVCSNYKQHCPGQWISKKVTKSRQDRSLNRSQTTHTVLKNKHKITINFYFKVLLKVSIDLMNRPVQSTVTISFNVCINLTWHFAIIIPNMSLSVKYVQR